MKKLIVLAVALLLVGCGAEGGDSARETTTQVAPPQSTTSKPIASTTALPTTTTMPKDQALDAMAAEVQRACAEAVSGLSDPEIAYDEAWAPYRTQTALLDQAKQCVKDKWAAVEEAERKAEEEQRRADEQRRAEEEAAKGTISQQNATQKAADYLAYTAFSRQGLIEQLVYEGFTQAQAEYGVSTTGL